MIEPSEFRRVMGHFSTGVAVVTSRRPDHSLCGLTANAICSVSLRPTLVLVCVERVAHTHDCILEAGAFAINVLGAQSGERLARRFAAWEADDKFTDVRHRTHRTGAPVLEEALAWVDCTLTEALPAGDHSIFLGEVAAADARDGIPLAYYRGGYGRFVP